MDVHVSNSSSDNSSDSRRSSSSGESLDDFHNNILQAGEIMGCQFEPRRDISSDSGESAGMDGDQNMSIDEDESNVRLGNLDWCLCEHCQIMDREEECVCCHDIEQVVGKNEEVMEHEKPNHPYNCITDNPGFRTVCLDRWVLQAAWFQYRQQYGNRAYEGPEHKENRHIAYRQLVRWCWGVLGKEIRVVLPSCAVSCIRAHFPPPGNEDDFEFVGFRFADE